MLIEEDFGKKRERAQGHVAPPPAAAQAPPLPLRQVKRRTSGIVWGTGRRTVAKGRRP